MTTNFIRPAINILQNRHRCVGWNARDTPRPSTFRRPHVHAETRSPFASRRHEIVDDAQERVTPGLDVVDEFRRKVLVDAARPEVIRMHSAA